jgi:hypothetical protein
MRVTLSTDMNHEWNRRMHAPQIRSIAFTCFAALSAAASLLLLEGLTEGLLPWTQLGCPGCPEASPDYPIQLMRWHGAEHGALLGVLFTGALLGLLWRARQRPLLVQFYVLGHLALLAGFLPFRPASTPEAHMLAFSVEVVVALALLCVLYPDARQLLSFRAAAPAPRLVAGAVASTIVMVPFGLQRLQWQLTGVGGVSAMESRWIESVILAACLILASVLTASRRPGWQTLGTITSLAYLYLGLAAIAVPDQPGSWGVLGGGVSIAGGLVYAAVVLAEARRGSPVATLRPASATA